MTTTVKTRDRRWLRWQITNPETGEVQDLTGCTVRFLVSPRHKGEAVPYNMEIDGDPVDGIVRYWYDGTIEYGMYDIEVEVTGPAGTIITSPTEGYGILQVEQDLG